MTDEEYNAWLLQRNVGAIPAPTVRLTSDVPLPNPPSPPLSGWTRDTSFLERSPVEEEVESDEDTDLSRIQVRAIGELIQGATITRVARSCGVSREWLYQCLKQPAFLASLQRRKQAATAQADLLAQQNATKAVLKLIAKMDDPRAKAADQIRAANSLLNYAQAGIEREQIVERIDRFERERNAPSHGLYRIVPSNDGDAA